MTPSAPWATPFTVHHHFYEELLSKVQTNLPQHSLRLSSCPISGCLGEETNSHLAAASSQGVAESDRVFPEPSFLWAKHPQLLQLFIRGLLFQMSQYDYNRQTWWGRHCFSSGSGWVLCRATEELRVKGIHENHHESNFCSSHGYLNLNHVTKSIVQVLLEL